VLFSISVLTYCSGHLFSTLSDTVVCLNVMICFMSVTALNEVFLQHQFFIFVVYICNFFVLFHFVVETEMPVCEHP